MKNARREEEEVKLRISRDDNNGMFFFFIGFRLQHGTEVYSAINLTAIVKNIIPKKNIFDDNSIYVEKCFHTINFMFVY